MEPLQFELYSAGDVAPHVNTPSDHPFVAACQSALAAVAGRPRALTGYPLTSDARWFAGSGLPIVIFGPGEAALAHAPNEFVPVAQVVEAAQCLTLLAYRWLGGRRPASAS